jgi:hypothetical protein
VLVRNLMLSCDPRAGVGSPSALICRRSARSQLDMRFDLGTKRLSAGTCTAQQSCSMVAYRAPLHHVGQIESLTSLSSNMSPGIAVPDQGSALGFTQASAGEIENLVMSPVLSLDCLGTPRDYHPLQRRDVDPLAHSCPPWPR